MPDSQTAPAFEGKIRVRDALKMSYGNSQTGISYGESYNIEYDPSARVAMLAALDEEGAEPDPNVELPPVLSINVSFDSKDGGDTMLGQGKSYMLTLVEVSE